MVSIRGDEPLMYLHLETVVAGLKADGRMIHICTNGMLVRRKIRARPPGRRRPQPHNNVGKAQGVNPGLWRGATGDSVVLRTNANMSIVFVFIGRVIFSVFGIGLSVGSKGMPAPERCGKL